ncbi:MAG: hypothetical protein DI528_08240 [Shinella sp.]|nr:MAG: hypothetical protein DI528_08240 [Shinella sp.]
MNRRRAYEQVEISFGGNAVTLRPTLRAATILEERFSFPALFRALDECNLPIISEIILVSDSSGNQNAAALLSAVSARPLSPFLDAVRQPLGELVSMFIPAPVQPLDTAPRTGKEIPWAEFYAGLYDVATGWLGWTPEQAWSTTPTEITRARDAHIEKLKAIHGSADDKQHRPDVDAEALSELLKSDDLDPEFDRDGLHALKGRTRKP